MGKRDNTKKNIQFDKSSKDDYGIDSGFSRIKKYRGENNYQTKTYIFEDKELFNKLYDKYLNKE